VAGSLVDMVDKSKRGYEKTQMTDRKFKKGTVKDVHESAYKIPRDVGYSVGQQEDQ
jgi:hypothetical protein